MVPYNPTSKHCPRCNQRLYADGYTTEICNCEYLTTFTISYPNWPDTKNEIITSNTKLMRDIESQKRDRKFWKLRRSS